MSKTLNYFSASIALTLPCIILALGVSSILSLARAQTPRNLENTSIREIYHEFVPGSHMPQFLANLTDPLVGTSRIRSLHIAFHRDSNRFVPGFERFHENHRDMAGGYHVAHTPPEAFSGQNCGGSGALRDCFIRIRSWMDGNPGHHPLFLHLSVDEPWHRDAWTDTGVEGFERLLRAEFGERLFTPLDLMNLLRRNSSSAATANLRSLLDSGEWPTRRELRGRIVVTLSTLKPYDLALEEAGREAQARERRSWLEKYLRDSIVPKAFVCSDEPSSSEWVVCRNNSRETAALSSRFLQFSIDSNLLNPRYIRNRWLMDEVAARYAGINFRYHFSEPVGLLPPSREFVLRMPSFGKCIARTPSGSLYMADAIVQTSACSTPLGRWSFNRVNQASLHIVSPDNPDVCLGYREVNGLFMLTSQRTQSQYGLCRKFFLTEHGQIYPDQFGRAAGYCLTASSAGWVGPGLTPCIHPQSRSPLFPSQQWVFDN